MKSVITTIAIILLVNTSNNITTDHLKVFEGEWNGTLTYLNYGDDQTLVDLSLRMVAEFDGKSLKFDYFYNEGNGRVEKRTGSFKLKGDDIIYNGKWDLKNSSITDLENWELQLESVGKDNNRPARFKKSILVSKDKIEVTKMVQYKDASGDFFMRNKHVFQR